MPACKMKFNAKGGGRGKGGRIGPCLVSVGAYGHEISSETAYFGGTSPGPNRVVEVAAPPVKAKVGGTKGGW